MFSSRLNQILVWCGNHKPEFIRWFYRLYLLYFMLVMTGSFLFLFHGPLLSFFLRVGSLSGKLAILAFLACTVPGMLGRFMLKSPFITLGMMFRTQTGIASFFLALGHAWLLFVLPALTSSTQEVALTGFEIFGAMALLLLAVLYATSNAFMKRWLGKGWKRLHRAVYLIYWLIFLHLIFQGLSTWSILMGIAAGGEVLSLVFKLAFDYRHRF